jgi:hypothetical protein
MAKAETLLKVVLTPVEPPEIIIKNYMLLNAEGEMTEKQPNFALKPSEMRDGFIKILDLKVCINVCCIFNIFHQGNKKR